MAPTLVLERRVWRPKGPTDASVVVRNSREGDYRRRPSRRPASLPAMTKIVIADDHRVVRSGLRMLLDREDGFEVVAEAGDVADARRYVRAHRPDVLILDLNMPGDPSLPAIPVFIRSRPPPAWWS